MTVRLIAALASAVAASSLHASIVTLFANHDATIYESTAGELGNGAGQFFFCGKTANGLTRRSLLSFDVASLAGFTITSATLTMHFNQGLAAPTTASLHRAMASWSEGPTDPDGGEGAGAPAAPGDVTWLHRSFGGDAWSNPGGDFDANASATTLIGGSFGFYSFSGAGLVADVQAWLDGSLTNNGWFMLGDESGPSTSKRFDSRNGDLLFQPTLTIEYAVPAPGAALAFVAWLALPRGRRRGSAQAWKPRR